MTGAGRNAIVVDDKEQNRYFLQSLLSGHGFQVRTARHGAEALVMARQTVPDIIISDLLMPVMDGYTLLRQWKADPALNAAPFVVYTATYTEVEDEKLALDLGADAFVLKPSEPDAFMARIEEVLNFPGVASPRTPGDGGADEASLLKHYSETLVRKLEEKTLQLSRTNEQLQADIERREAAERALRASEERFRMLARATNDAIWDWDIVDGRRWWGNGFTELFGHAEGEAGSSAPTWTQLIHPDDRSRVLEALDALLASDADLWSADYRFQRADGSWAQVEDRGVMVRDDSGRALRMVGGLSDVTDRKAMEEQFNKSQRLEAIGQLTGGVAHDFNNLLTVVLGNAEVLAEHLVDDPQNQALARMIAGAAERGADLTRRLLAFARKQTLSPRAVDLNDLVSGLDPLLRRVLASGIEVRFEHGSDLPPALVDPALLEHALLNLCLNARDAMPDGGTLTITTSLRSVDAPEASRDALVNPGDYLSLQVSDTGTGISTEHLERIFEPFFTTKSEGKGTGLGLAMVYGFVKQSGGHVLVHSVPGHGAQFTLLLPCAEAGTSSDTVSEVATENTAPGNEHVLLVEDDALVRDYARALLVALGYRVTEVANGREALVVLQEDPSIELLFSDVAMPGISGFQLAERARELRSDLPVLLTSGFPGSPDGVDDMPDSSIWPMLGKPYRRAELASQLRKALNR